MTIRLYSSISQETTLTSSLAGSTSATTMVVNSASALMSSIAPTGTQTFTVVIDPDTALEEIVDVVFPSAASSNTLTIVRAIDSSQAIAHSAGAKVRHMGTGRDFREANDHIENTTTAHGLTLANLVETTDTATVTNTMLAGGIADGKLNTISSSGKVANSATTATSSNTGSTIVARDISGNFTAGTITANLTGNVTGNVTGNASGSAATLATPRDFQLTGDIEASAVSFNGSTSVNLVTSIATGSIVNADVNASAAIAKSKLNLGGTITSADLVDGTIVNADINASAGIALSKLAVDPIARANHTGSQTASTISDFDTQVRTNRLDQMAAPTAAVSVNSQKITNLASPVDNGDAVSLGYLNSQKGIANGIAELDGSGLVPTHHLPALAITNTSVVNSQSAMLALTAQVGDIAVRTDVNKSFILTATPATTLGNWQELLSPTDAVLSVDGSTGAVSLSGTYINRTTGQLLGNLDANTHKVTGLGTPTNNTDAATKAYVDTVAGSATAAAASATAAAASYDSFDDRYLGAKSTPPTLDNDGNALVTGAIYWNSVSNQMFAWTGSAWGSISSTADIYRFRYTAAGGETSESGLDDNGLTLSYIPGKEQVYLNGVLLARTSDYNATNGTSITGLAALTAGDILEVITFTAFELADSIARSLFDAKGDLLVATSADTPGKLTVGSNGTVLVADSSTATGLKWSAYDPLPNQSGNNGKYLTTDGSTTSWGAITTDPTPTVFMLGGM
jgi:hypothetical protein